jgi:transcriptional regulator with XRE-family HTH domain
MLYSPDLTWFAYARARLGITQQQLANSLGISRSQLAMAETGKRKLSGSAMDYLEKMHAIAKELPIPELVTRRRIAGFVPLKEYNRVTAKAIRLLPVSANNRVRQYSIVNSPSTTAPINYTMQQHIMLTFYKADAMQQAAPSVAEETGLKVQQQQLRCRLQYMQLEQKNAAELSMIFTAQLKCFDIRIALREASILQYPKPRLQRKWLGEKLFLAWKRSLLEKKSMQYDAEAMEERDAVIERLAGELKWLEKIINNMDDSGVGMEKHLQVAA